MSFTTTAGNESPSEPTEARREFAIKIDLLSSRESCDTLAHLLDPFGLLWMDAPARIQVTDDRTAWEAGADGSVGCSRGASSRGPHGRVSTQRLIHGPAHRSRQLVTVAPVDPAKVEVGDIVLARVAGTTYLHLVSAVDASRDRVQISNNRGRVNGWTNYARLYGICMRVDGVPRPRTAGKTRRS